MAMESKYKGWVIFYSCVAAAIGLVVGWFPGSDIVGLLFLWVFAIAHIIRISGFSELNQFFGRLIIMVVAAGFLFASGVELASTIGILLFFVINPVLNYVATYRVLRAASKLFARQDAEESLSNFFGSAFDLIGLITGLWGDD